MTTHPVVHFEFGGTDGSALAGFYGKLFGWDVQDGGPDYWLLQTGGEGIAGGVLQTAAGMPPYVTVYISVEDLDAFLSAAEALGASRIVGPTPIPGVGAFAMFRDPEGNVVGLMREDAGARG
jgi:predicted enzyme related to lactoylglutathione lyase